MILQIQQKIALIKSQSPLQRVDIQPCKGIADYAVIED